jgi:hypothetical protein
VALVPIAFEPLKRGPYRAEIRRECPRPIDLTTRWGRS